MKAYEKILWAIDWKANQLDIKTELKNALEECAKERCLEAEKGFGNTSWHENLVIHYITNAIHAIDNLMKEKVDLYSCLDKG